MNFNLYVSNFLFFFSELNKKNLRRPINKLKLWKPNLLLNPKTKKQRKRNPRKIRRRRKRNQRKRLRRTRIRNQKKHRRQPNPKTIRRKRTRETKRSPPRLQ